jgi:hypothetical protein
MIRRKTHKELYGFGAKRDRQITIVYLNRRKRLPIQIVEKNTKQMQCDANVHGWDREKEGVQNDGKLLKKLENYARGERKSNRQNKVYLHVCRKRRKTQKKMQQTDTELQRRLLHEKKRQKNTDRGHN